MKYSVCVSPLYQRDDPSKPEGSEKVPWCILKGLQSTFII